MLSALTLATFAGALAATPAGPVAAMDAQAAAAASTSSSSSAAAASSSSSMRECVGLGRAERGDVAIASMMCVDDGVLIEERYVEQKKVRDKKSVHRRNVQLP